jgi:hypothetical protein
MATLLKIIIIDPQDLYLDSGVVKYIDRAIIKYKILIILILFILIKSLLDDIYKIRLLILLFILGVFTL